MGIGGQRAQIKIARGTNKQLRRVYQRDTPGQFATTWKPSKRAKARTPKKESDK